MTKRSNADTGVRKRRTQLRKPDSTTTKPNTKRRRPHIKRRKSAHAAHKSPAIELVSAGTLAKEWDCAVSTVHRLLARKEIKPYFLNDARNGTKRYRREDINAYLDRCKVG